MPRKPRFNAPGVVYHLISRFVDREWFITNEQERTYYLSLLGRALEHTDWRCFSFAVMSNHIHLGTIAGEQSLDAWIRRVHSPFADWMNRVHGRIGGIFVRGPKDRAVPRSGVANVIAYIHNNPVRAKIVAAPSESTWTSHRAYVGLQAPPPWLDVEAGLALAGAGNGDAFDRWVQTSPAETDDDDPDVLTSAANAPDRESAVAAPVDPDEIVRITSKLLGVAPTTLRSRRRGTKQVLGRSVAAHCADALGLSGTSIAQALGMSQQGVSAILTRETDRTEVLDCMNRVIELIGSDTTSPLPRPCRRDAGEI